MTCWRGQDRAVAELSRALTGNRLHHAWMLAGAEGVGKGGIALDFAKRLLGAAPAEGITDTELACKAGDPVATLIDAGTHPDLTILRRLPRDAKKGEAQTLARNITVDQVRGLGRFLHLAPSMADRRVVIIDAADDLERGAANALLKNLEEPPRGTVFLLITHSPGRLLPTIRSRCRFLPFDRLDDRDMEAALAAAAPDMSASERAALIVGAEGAPGRALAMRGLEIDKMLSALDQIVRARAGDHGGRIALARSLSGRAAQPRYEAFLDLVPHYIAQHVRGARTMGDAARAHLWQEAVAMGRGAIPLSLDPAATVMGLCEIVAQLAPARPQ